MQIRKILLASMAVMMMAGAPAVMAEEGAHEGPGKMMKNDADTDGDGFLSKAEFQAVQDKRFAEMDANADGKISKDEMKSHFKAMKDKFDANRKAGADKKPAQ